MELLRDQKEVLEAMGVALFMLQSAEKVIRLCTTFVLQKSSPLTLDLLQQQEESERAKTLGYFLSELRKRVSVHESFDSLLTDFLNNRNDFIHDLSRVKSVIYTSVKLQSKQKCSSSPSLDRQKPY
jgi:hypothetical protein